MKKGVLKNFSKFTGKHKRARVSFLHVDNIPSSKSFMQIKNKSRPNTNSWGAPE